MKLNRNYLNLEESYLFSTVAHKVSAFSAAHPEAKILRMGIGDVTLPLAPAVVEAMQKAVSEMGKKETFRGYGPEQGYDYGQHGSDSGSRLSRLCGYKRYGGAEDRFCRRQCGQRISSHAG